MPIEPALRALVAYQSLRFRLAERLGNEEKGDAGEGVISTAIAVLVMAFLGVAMWLAFRTIFDEASANVSEQVNQIGT